MATKRVPESSLLKKQTNNLKITIMKTNYWDTVEVRDVIRIKNCGDKLSRQLLSLVDFSRGNNYYSDVIRVAIISDGSIEVSTICVNDYGREISNENYTHVFKGDIPYFTAKKLGLI